MTDIFFDMFCGMILTLAVIALFIGCIGVVTTALVYLVRFIAKWWRKRNE